MRPQSLQSDCSKESIALLGLSESILKSKASLEVLLVFALLSYVLICCQDRIALSNMTGDAQAFLRYLHPYVHFLVESEDVATLKELCEMFCPPTSPAEVESVIPEHLVGTASTACFVTANFGFHTTGL